MSTHSGRAPYLKAIALRKITDHECCTFVAHLMDYAIDCGQQFDDEWIAEVAGLRMLGDALFWYTDLDEETQESWKKLRKALLKEAKLRSGSSSLVASATALLPVPAAAPEGASSADRVTRLARIRAEGVDPQCCGYLSSDLDRNGCVEITKEVRNALIVQYDTTDDFPTLNIMNPSHENSALGIQWIWDPEQDDRYLCFGYLVMIRQTFPTTSSWTAFGPWDAAVFLIQPNLSLLALSSLLPDRYILDTFMLKGTDKPRICLLYDEAIKDKSMVLPCRVNFKIESL